MKEIGEKLKEARENIGITVSEASEDLKLTEKQLEDIESGNMEAFKDILSIKYFIRDYAKYLGLDYEDIVDEFNEYLFDYTSKISLEEIKEAKKKISGEDEKKIISPYTIEHKEKAIIPGYIIAILVLILLTLIGFFAYIIINENNSNDDNGVVINVK